VGVSEPDETEHGGFRELVAGLLDANLARDPDRRLLVTRRESVALLATDAGVAVTIQLLPGAAGGPGTVLVHDGEDPWAEVVVRGPSVELLELAATPLRFGLPDALASDGRQVLRDIARRRISVHGLVRRLPTVRRITRLLSVR
jgi:hypothetical protein